MSEGQPGVLPPSSYDDVLYEGGSFPQTHPDRLATLGTLFGLAPAPVDRCRVLELGCAMGANLIPMAFQLPDSTFVGVDASGRQVAAARDEITALGLQNIRIEHASILDVNESWGAFDYLICHGVYSWVPDTVQDRILAIAAQNLQPQGVAYISYNTYPGWHMREMIRHMMLYHVRQFSETGERIAQARALLDFLAGNVDTNTYYGALLQSELNLIRQVRDSYLFHEHLEEVNAPVYFYEFVDRATRHGLRYLGEADFSTMLTSGFPAATAETLERISPDIVRAEQYMDFLRKRFFRQTLLCHADRPLERHLTPASLRGLLLASSALPDEAIDNAVPGFRTPDGRSVTTEFPLTRAALTVLSEHWPLALDQETLLAEATARLTPAPDLARLEHDRSVTLEHLLHCYSTSAIDLRTWQVPCTNQVSPTPRISRLAAYQARSGTAVTNQLHATVRLDLVGRQLVPILDGTRDRPALRAELTAATTRGDLTLERDGQAVNDEAEVRGILETALDQALNSLARQGLLVV